MGVVASSIKSLTNGLIASLHRNFGRKGSPASDLRKAEIAMVHHILVASYTDSIYTLVFDSSKTADKALSLRSALEIGHHPSWIEHHPSDPTIVFTGLEQTDGRLLALKYNLDNGKGELLASGPSRGADPCSILATKNDILVANYSSGNIGFYALSPPKEPYSLVESQPPLHFSGSGPCLERQSTSHPHQVYHTKRDSSSSSGPTEDVLVPDLGSDKTWRLSRNSEGRWEKSGQIDYDKHLGGGPRHVVVYDSKLYTILELINTITVHDLKLTGSGPRLVAEVTLPTPENLTPQTMLAAEILCPPPNSQFPFAFLYGSNRNDPRPHGDLISIFSTHNDGESVLEHVSDVPTGLAHVRGFTFFGPDDRYVVVGGANGGGVKVFERIDAGRSMREVAHLPASDGGVGLAPTAFLCL